MYKAEVQVFVIVFVLFSRVPGQITCTGIGICQCSMSDGSGVIDISSLGNADGTAAFPDVYASDGYFYSYNPCYGFTKGSCENVAACQISGDEASQYPIADVTSSTFSYDGRNVHVSYSHTDDTGFQRTFDVKLQCDQTADQPTFLSHGEASPGSGRYSAKLKTKCACPDLCASAPPPPKSTVPETTKSPEHKGGTARTVVGLTVEDWLIIIFGSIAFLYVGGGIVALIRIVRLSGVSPLNFIHKGRGQGYREMVEQ